MTRTRKVNCMLLIVVSYFLIFGLGAYRAQAELVQSDVSVSTIPEIPGANERVTIKLTSYSIDLNRALIVWKVDGKTALSETGATSYSLQSGPVGSKITITAAISITGASLTKTIILKPSAVDLLWESADSYVPPFYKGKAMPSSESVLKIVAIPEIESGGQRIGSDAITFSWERNFTAYPDFSGFAKSSFLFKTSYLNATEKISVAATAVNGGMTASNTISITTGAPQILFYEYKPLRGVLWSRELGSSFSFSGSEATVAAEPFFFSPADARSADLKYTWKINGATIGTPAKKNYLVVRKPEGGTGSASIELAIDNIPRLFQSAKKFISIKLQ